VTDPLDPNSPRVVEHNAAGGVLGELPSFTHHDASLGLTLVIVPASGMTAAGTQRRFFVYLDTVPNGPKAPPGWWEASASTVFGNPAMFMGNINDEGPGFMGTLERTGEQSNWYGHHTKLLTSAGEWGSHARVSAQVYGVVEGPRYRVDQPELRVLETVSSAGVAGDLTVRVFTVLTTSTVWQTHVLFENAPTAAAAITGASFFVSNDLDIGDAGNDLASYDAMRDMSVVQDAVVTPFFVLAGPASTAHTCNDYSATHEEVLANTLINQNGYAGDVGVAFQWPLPDVAPGTAASLRFTSALVDDLQAARDVRAAYVGTPPAITVGAMENAP
jgi:hypothetical protein